MFETRTFKLLFKSDWHIGSGAGIPGSVDRQVLRDDKGLPYVPGKTLTGMLRDAAEWIADTRDESEKGCHWNKALVSLFGEQPESHGGTTGAIASEAKIGIGSAKLSEDVQNYLSASPELLPSLFITQPGVAIEPKTGRSLENHLFTTEKVRKNCVMFAQLKIFRALSEDEEKLLEDAIKAVRRLGGKRRRGGGMCFLDWSDTNSKAKNTSVEKNRDSLLRVSDDMGFVELNFKLKTCQPVIINRETLGNVVRSEMIIPGSYLLYYFANEIFGSANREDIREAILSGDFSIGNFLPEFDGSRSYPVPLSMLQEKDSKYFFNGLIQQSNFKKQTKDVRSGYITLNEKEKKINYHSAGFNKVMRAHNTVDDKSQRPNSNVGGLYTYEAIDSGRTFRGTVRIKKYLWDKLSGNADVVNKLLFSTFFIGQSRKDEYGKVKLEYNASAKGLENYKPELVRNKYLTVYLVSDVIIRGKNHAYSTDINDLRLALESELGIELEDVPDNEWLSRSDKDGRKISPQHTRSYYY